MGNRSYFPIGETNSDETYGVGTGTGEATIVQSFRKMSINCIDTTETVLGMSIEEIGKLGILFPGASPHCFQKMSTLDSSP